MEKQDNSLQRTAISADAYIKLLIDSTKADLAVLLSKKQEKEKWDMDIQSQILSNPARNWFPFKILGFDSAWTKTNFIDAVTPQKIKDAISAHTFYYDRILPNEIKDYEDDLKQLLMIKSSLENYLKKETSIIELKLDDSILSINNTKDFLKYLSFIGLHDLIHRLIAFPDLNDTSSKEENSLFQVICYKVVLSVIDPILEKWQKELWNTLQKDLLKWNYREQQSELNKQIKLIEEALRDLEKIGGSEDIFDKMERDIFYKKSFASVTSEEEAKKLAKIDKIEAATQQIEKLKHTVLLSWITWEWFTFLDQSYDTADDLIDFCNLLLYKFELIKKFPKKERKSIMWDIINHISKVSRNN